MAAARDPASAGSSDWTRIKEIVADALEREPEARAAFLDAACRADDAALRQRIEHLLALDASAEHFLRDAPTLTVIAADRNRERVNHDDHDVDGDVDVDVDDGEAPPRRIGRYELRRRIGTGGVGVVYEAVQQQPHRTVALKLLSTGELSDTLLRRFERESQVLAHLHHPGIAHVYEAGIDDATPLRLPYIAMELIRNAQTIVAYGREHSLSVEEKLELFIEACRAVQHAHERGVIHRDLKPANILVDETGQPKIIDFGVARMRQHVAPRDAETAEAAGDADHARTLHTSQGDIIGTLAYMAPEQTAGDPSAIDARVDVYALGVVLFEMLTARLPLELAGLPLPQAIASIRDMPAARLARIAPQLAPDLDAITARALRKRPENRYESVAALAADLRRHLDHRPVVARPPSVMYHARLFARRHRVGVAAAALVALGLLAATFISAAFAVQAQRAARAEAHQRHVAERISEYLTDILSMPNPHYRGANITVLQMLDQMIARLDSTREELPEVEAAVRLSAGDTYLALDLFEQAEQQFERAVALLRDLGAAQQANLADALNLLGLTCTMLHKHDAAEAAFRECVAIVRELPSGASLDVAVYLGNLATALIEQDQLAEAEPLVREVLDQRVREYGPNHLFVIGNYRKLADLRRRQGDLEGAEQLLREALRSAREILERSHPILTATLGELGRLQQHQGRLDEAYVLLREAWDIAREHRSPGSPDWNLALRDAVECLRALNDHSSAVDLLNSACATVAAARGDDDPIVIRLRAELADMQREVGTAPVNDA